MIALTLFLHHKETFGDTYAVTEKQASIIERIYAERTA